MPPTKLAHLVFQTNRLPAMRDWYCTVLDGHVIYENLHLSFVTYDDEHHRVAFIDFGPLAAREVGGSDLRYRTTDQPGLHHVAFTFGSHDLLCQHPLHGGELVANDRRALEFEPAGGLLHPSLEQRRDFIVTTL